MNKTILACNEVLYYVKKMFHNKSTDVNNFILLAIINFIKNVVRF